MLQLIQISPTVFFIVLIGLILALTVHEAAHAYSAKLLGDDTPERYGRLTLNPIAHLDLLGFLALLFFRFGWGKPVPVNPNNFKHPAFGNLLVAVSGPLSNLILATIVGLIARFLPADTVIFSVLESITYINILLALFNLIPIPPLDGSKIIGLFVRQETYIEMERLGPFILIAFIFFASTAALPFFEWFSTIISAITGWIIG